MGARAGDRPGFPGRRIKPRDFNWLMHIIPHSLRL
jgi:hypothetical protein